MCEGVHCRTARDRKWKVVGVGWVEERNARIGLEASEGALRFERMPCHDRPGRSFAAGAGGSRYGNDGQNGIFVNICEKLFCGNVVCGEHGHGLCGVKRRTAADTDDKIRTECARLRADGAALLHVRIVADPFEHAAFDLFMAERRDHVRKRSACAAGMLARYDERALTQTQCGTVAPHYAAPKADRRGKMKPKFHKNLRNGINNE